MASLLFACSFFTILLQPSLLCCRNLSFAPPHTRPLPHRMGFSQGGGSALFLVLLCCALAVVVQGVQHQVGGAPGWSIPSLANVNYTVWASTQKFVVGDTLYFKYSKAFHNVLEVTKTNYDSCNAANPITTFDDGATTITLNKTGTFYFICGFPTHCTLGQKVEIKVASASSSAPTPSPSPVPTMASSEAPSSMSSAAPSPGQEAPTPSSSLSSPVTSPPANSAHTFKCTIARGLMVAVSSLMILV